MKAYYFVFVFTLLLSLILNSKTENQWRWKILCTFLPLFVFGALRVDFGNDYESYLEVYEQIHSSALLELDYDSHVEIGYQLLNWMMPSYRSLLVLNAFLLSFSLALFCYHNIPKRFLWIFIILLFLNPEKNIYGNLVTLRSGLCVSSFILSFIFIQKRRWAPFFILTIALSFIHTSVLIFLPIAYLVGSNKSFKYVEAIIWIVAGILISMAPMTKLFNVISMMISNDVFERYEVVLSGVASHRGLLQSITCLVFLILFIYYFLLRRDSFIPAENSLLRVGMLFPVSLFLGSLSMRAGYFYNVFFIAAVVKVFSDKQMDNVIRWGLLLLTIASSLYSMYFVWMGSPWWDHEIYHSLIGSW